MKLLFLPSIIMLVWVLNHNIRRNNSHDPDRVHSYLAREDRANATRRKDLSDLPYIQVPLDQFPFDITLNDEKKQSQIAEYEKIIRNLANVRMLNLIGISNTELKEMYGPANLELLSNYDQCYAKYLRTLQLFCDTIYEEYPEQAVSVLEYCIATGTDISGTYGLLGAYYLEHGRISDFEKLYDRIPQKESISGKVIVSKLDQIKNETV